MVNRFRSAQSRQRQERMKKIQAVKPHFARFERVITSKREQEASKNFNQYATYVQSQHKILQKQRKQEKDKLSLLNYKRDQVKAKFDQTMDRRRAIQQEYLQKCKLMNNKFKKRQAASHNVSNILATEQQTLREINRLRLDDVMENKEINKNKAMTIKAHIIQKHLMK